MADYLVFADDKMRNHHDRLLRDAWVAREFSHELESILSTARQCSTREHMLLFLEETVKENQEKIEELQRKAATVFKENTVVEKEPENVDVSEWLSKSCAFNPAGPLE